MAKIVALLLVVGTLLLPRSAATADKVTLPGTSPAATSGALSRPGQVTPTMPALVDALRSRRAGAAEEGQAGMGQSSRRTGAPVSTVRSLAFRVSIRSLRTGGAP